MKVCNININELLTDKYGVSDDMHGGPRESGGAFILIVDIPDKKLSVGDNLTVVAVWSQPEWVIW